MLKVSEFGITSSLSLAHHFGSCQQTVHYIKSKNNYISQQYSSLLCMHIVFLGGGDWYRVFALHHVCVVLTSINGKCMQLFEVTFIQRVLQ